MLFTKNFLFIHTPKTAGMSITKLLIDASRDHLFVTGESSKFIKKGNVTYLPQGKRHETLLDAESFLIYRNKSIFDFDKIFSVMRCPYDLELSRYTYLRNGYPWDKGPAQELALGNDFTSYLRTAPFFGMNPPRLHYYFTLNGLLPDNLIILKFEKLDQHIKNNLSIYLDSNYVIPFENKSSHQSYKELFNSETEEICYNRNKWFFDKGFYEREVF